MVENSLVYSNARVKSLENGFLSSDKINRMVYSESLEEAVRVLLESNYGGGTIANAYDFEDILKAEEIKVNAFMSESMIPKMGLETFLVKNDYHNAKAIMKVKYMHETDISYMQAPNGLLEIEAMKNAITNDNYDSLPKDMAKALMDIDEARVLGNKSPRLIDVLLDKAMYKNIFAILKTAKADSIVKYWQANVDFSNISTFIRSKNIKQDERFFSDNFIDGGTLKKELFTSLYEQPLDSLLGKLKYTQYANIVTVIDPKDLVPFETAWDNYLIGIFKEDKTDVFSIAPLAGYYIAKKIEIKVARMILILIKNKVDVNVIKQRLRDYYA